MGNRSMTYIILARGVRLTDDVSRYLKDSVVLSDERGRLFVYESNFIPIWARDALGLACTLDLEKAVAIQRFLGTLPRDALYMKREGTECGTRGRSMTSLTWRKSTQRMRKRCPKMVAMRPQGRRPSQMMLRRANR